MTSFIDAEIEQLQSDFCRKTPQSALLFAQASRMLPGGNTRNNLYFSPYMPFVERGEEGVLIDVDGNHYVDLLNDYTVAMFGHSHPRLLRAIEEQLPLGMSFGACIAAETRLAEAIAKRFPAMNMIRFSNSGTEANLYALLTALAYAGKSKVIVFEGNYHGGVMNYCHVASPINAPFELLQLPYNDSAAFDRAMEEHGDSIGAVIMELMMNTGGCIPAERDFATRVRAATAAADIPLVIDEVMTARLDYHGLQQQYGIVADITSLGKFIGGGFSIGAFGGSEKYMAMYDARQAGFTPHGGSFNNNVMSMSVGTVALEEVLTREVQREVNQRGERMRELLNTVFQQADVPLVFSGGGSVMNLHLGRVAPRQKLSSHESAKIQKLFHRYMLSRGYWVASRCLIALSTAITDQMVSAFVAEVEHFVQRYAEAIRALEASSDSLPQGAANA